MSARTLGAADLASLTGFSPRRAEDALRAVALSPLVYRALNAVETAAIEAEVDRVIAEGALRQSGENDPSAWTRGWAEVAAALKGRPITADTLRPQYFRGAAACRLDGRYIRPLKPEFEYDAGLAVRQLVFDEFLPASELTVEFGCGTGVNLWLLAARYPGMRLIGCDWAPASREILAEMARQSSWPIECHTFNMLTAEGWSGEAVDSRAAVLTVHAMEQLGTQWRAFAEFLLARRPALCVHIEPLFELYAEQDTFDERARRYHLKRGYLRGYYPYLMAQAREGRIEIVAARRVRFGGLYHEAYSILVWRPQP